MGVFDHLYDSLMNNVQMQTSLKYGVGIASAAALSHFLARGRADSALKLWIFVFLPVTLGTSFYLDYQKVKQKLKTQQYEAALKHRLITGLEDDAATKNS